MTADLKRRAIIFAVVFVSALVFIAPTVFRDQLKSGWISKPISLGLDLSGGVHLVYEVQSAEAVKSRLQGIANTIRGDLRKEKIAVTKSRVIENNQIEITLLSDRSVEAVKDVVSQNYRELSFNEAASKQNPNVLVFGISDQQAQKIESNATTQSIETLRERVDQFGVAEPIIQRVGEKRILLQMPGVSDISSVKKIVGSVAKLEFRFVPRPGSPAGDTIQLKDRDGAPVTVDAFAPMTGDAVDDARVGIVDGQVDVSLSLTAEGARTFAKLTAENVGRQMAIILDNVVYSSPVIRERISGGHASISGGFTMEEARQLAVVLRAGALPAPLTVMEERTVGPSLGKESIQKGILAISVGFIAILIFMGVYYGKSGMVTVSTLALNLLLMLGGLSAFGATLTLPGLAGLALTIGMAVDANVIIFERIRDELRNGSTRDAAVEAGFGKAFSAILDSNLTTLLSGVILYYFGTGPIRGFAVTLCIGILTTIYCAVFVSRMAFDLLPLQGRKGLSV